MRRVIAAIILVASFGSLASGGPRGEPAQDQPQIVDTPTVKVLKGLTAPEFDEEMKQITIALGVNCGFCHVRGNFASDDNPRKATARRMLEMTGKINQQFFPGTRRVTCYTCHQGEQKPRQPDA